MRLVSTLSVLLIVCVCLSAANTDTVDVHSHETRQRNVAPLADRILRERVPELACLLDEPIGDFEITSVSRGCFGGSTNWLGVEWNEGGGRLRFRGRVWPRGEDGHWDETTLDVSREEARAIVRLLLSSLALTRRGSFGSTNNVSLDARASCSATHVERASDATTDMFAHDAPGAAIVDGEDRGGEILVFDANHVARASPWRLLTPIARPGKIAVHVPHAGTRELLLAAVPVEPLAIAEETSARLIRELHARHHDGVADRP